jgi:hypothetical protein
MAAIRNAYMNITMEATIDKLIPTNVSDPVRITENSFLNIHFNNISSISTFNVVVLKRKFCVLCFPRTAHCTLLYIAARITAINPRYVSFYISAYKLRLNVCVKMNNHGAREEGLPLSVTDKRPVQTKETHYHHGLER